MKMVIVVLVASTAMLAISESVEAGKRCGSSWEICAQRGKGPGAAQGVVQPGSKQIKQQQR
jgi:hypothetical protein